MSHVSARQQAESNGSVCHCPVTARPQTSLILLSNSPRKVTESQSQHGRGWQGPLWVTQSNPPAKAGSPTAGCTGPCPGGAGISPEKETPQPPWAACSSAPSPSEGIRSFQLSTLWAGTCVSSQYCQYLLPTPPPHLLSRFLRAHPEHCESERGSRGSEEPCSSEGLRRAAEPGHSGLKCSFLGKSPIAGSRLGQGSRGRRRARWAATEPPAWAAREDGTCWSGRGQLCSLGTNHPKHNCRNPGTKRCCLVPDTPCSFHWEKNSHLWGFFFPKIGLLALMWD